VLRVGSLIATPRSSIAAEARQQPTAGAVGCFVWGCFRYFARVLAGSPEQGFLEAMWYRRRPQGVIRAAMPPPAPLKLIALDADDLAVISAHVQDARVQPSDIVWRQDEKRLVVGLNRLDWEQTLSGGACSRRLVAALRFDRVLACKSRNIDLAAPDAPLELLGVEFHVSDPPSGSALLMFGHGGALRLDVECLECELTDLDSDDLGMPPG